ncbi:MAG: type II secretion system protein [Planctomycetota bacterium]
MKNELRRDEGGFTLIELLVVIAIIAVLATIILPGMGNIRKQAKNLNCAKNLEGLYKGLVMYENEYKFYPSLTGKDLWNALRDPTLYPSDVKPPLYQQHGLFVCPVRGSLIDKANPLASWAYRGPGSALSYAFDDSVPIGADVETNHTPKGKKAVNVLYFGGKVSEVKEGDPEWQDLSPDEENGIPGVIE